jgi:hypothetical protein
MPGKRVVMWTIAAIFSFPCAAMLITDVSMKQATAGAVQAARHFLDSFLN